MLKKPPKAFLGGFLFIPPIICKYSNVFVSVRI